MDSRKFWKGHKQNDYLSVNLRESKYMCSVATRARASGNSLQQLSMVKSTGLFCFLTPGHRVINTNRSEAKERVVKDTDPK